MGNNSIVQNARNHASDEEKPDPDGYLWASTKTVLLGDFYEDPTIFGLGVRAGVGCIPGVGQLMDFSDTAAWTVLAYERGPDDPEVKLNGAILFIGYVPGVGDVLRAVLKSLVSNRATKSLASLLEKLANTISKNQYKALKEAVFEQWKKNVDAAVKIAHEYLDKFSELLKDIKDKGAEYLPDSMAEMINAFITFIGELRNTVESSFRNALAKPREQLEKLLEAADKATDPVKVSAKATAKRLDDIAPPVKSEGVKIDKAVRKLTHPEIIARRRRFLTDKEYQREVTDAFYKRGEVTEGLEPIDVFRVDTRGDLPDGFTPNPNASYQTEQDFVHFSADPSWDVQKYFPYLRRYGLDADVHKAGQRGLIGEIHAYEVKVVGVRSGDFDELDLPGFHSTNYPKFEDVVLAPSAPPSAITRKRRIEVSGEVVDIQKIPDDHPYWDYSGHSKFPAGKDGWQSSNTSYSFWDLKAEEGIELAVPKGDSWIIDKKVPKSLDTDIPRVDPDYRGRTIKAGPGHPKGADSPAAPKCEGDPVDVVSGAMLTDETDFVLPGPLPLEFSRAWSSIHASRLGSLGRGWAHSLDQSLEVENDGIAVHIAGGRTLEFAPLDNVGDSTHNRGSKHTLLRLEKGYVLYDDSGLRLVFGDVGRFDGALSLAGITDRNDNRIRLQYEKGLLVGGVDSAGRAIRFINNEDGFLVGVEVPHPDGPKNESGNDFVRIVSYEYDDEPHLTKVRDALGNAASYSYDEGHLIVTATDRNGISFFWEYDRSGLWPRCSKTWGDGQVLYREFQYDRPHRITTVTDGSGNRTIYHGNTIGMPGKKIDALGGVTLYDYNEDGNLLSETDALGHVTRFAYDELGREVAVVNVLGHRSETEYNLQGLPSARVDALGQRWDREYDELGNVVAATDPAGGRWLYAFSSRGLVTTATDPRGHATRFHYDDAGNMTSVTDRTGATTSYLYDSLGRVLKKRDPLEGETSCRWDLMDREIQVSDALGRSQSFAYDGEGNLVSHVDSLGREHHRTYGPSGMLLMEQSPSGATTRNQYDAELNLVAVEDARGETWRFELDALGRRCAEVGFDGRRKVYGYDVVGRLASKTSSRGQVTTFEHNALGQLVRKGFSDNTEARFAYDALGRMVSASNPAAEITFSYDHLGNVIEECSSGASTKYRYDLVGNRIERVSPWQRSLQLEYTAENQLKSVKGEHGALHLDYDPLGREVLRRLPGGSQLVKEYLPTGEIHSSQAFAPNKDVLNGRQYSYTASGRVSAVNDLRYGSAQYKHDQDDRLQSAVYGEDTEQYAQDGVGNMPGVPGLARLTEVNGWKVEWDEDGNILSKHKDALHFGYQYDATGRLATVRKKQHEIESVVSFSYDALGRRVSKSCQAADKQQSTQFFWDGDVLLGEENSGGSLEYLHAPNSFQPMAAFGPQGAFFLECDHLDAPHIAVNNAGTLLWTASYKAYGEVKDQEGPPGCVPFRFAGQYADAETGLHYNRYRYYDPDLRMYGRVDPLGLGGGMAVYSYPGDPLSFIDPFGLSCKKPSSAGKMQQEVRRDQAPRDVRRVDRAHQEGGEPHVHFDDATSLNSSGSVHDAHKGTPNPPKKTQAWLEGHGWASTPK